MTGTSEAERAKYEHIWTHADYREYSPGEQAADRVLAWMAECGAWKIVEVGCGTGRLATLLEAAGLDVLATDTASNCLDLGVGVPFERRCLWRDGLPPCDATVSSDVLEHLPPEVVDTAVTRLAESAPHGWHHVHLGPDGAGPKLWGSPLHLTQRPAEWWLDRFESILARPIAGEVHNDVNLTLWY